MIEVETLRKHRNLIVHGLWGGDARPAKGDAYITCVEGGYATATGNKKSYTLDELEALTQSIDRCRLAFNFLGNWQRNKDKVLPG